MYQEIARKRPAVVMRKQSHPYAMGVVPMADGARMVLRDRDRGVVSAQVTKMWQAGQIERDYRTSRDGEWFVAVVKLKPHRTWLAKHWWKLALGVAAVAGGTWAVYLAAVALLAVLAALVPYLFAVMILAAMGAVLGGRRLIEVTQKVRIRG
jgi:hypothetical protein